jgi:hypothetical protein
VKALSIGLIFGVVWSLLTLPFAWLWSRPQRRFDQPWVVGGHRGRLVEDNAGELLHWVRDHTGQPLIWIANPVLAAELRNQGIAALDRDTWAARLAILKAPVLIYSHGNDDLDSTMHAWQWLTGLRVYLNHSMNVYKAGNAWTPEYKTAGPLKRWFLRRTMTDFDLLLASSSHERDQFALAFPHRIDRLRPAGGGAHLDSWFRLAATPSDRSIYWFPTHRDDDSGRQALTTTIAALTSNPELKAWLESENRAFRIGAHINTGSVPVELQAPFEWRDMSTLKADLARADVFISDYSGLVANFMVFDRPEILFVFDRQEYLRNRLLYASVEDIATGPVVESIDQLVVALTTGEWHDTDRSRERRAQWRERLFVHETPIYAGQTYRAICDALKCPPRLNP